MFIRLISLAAIAAACCLGSAQAQVQRLPATCGGPTTAGQNATYTDSLGNLCTRASSFVVAPNGNQYITLTSTASTLTVPAGYNTASIVVETASVRYRCDGTAPTATVGSILSVGGPYTFAVAPLTACQFILASGSAGTTLDVEYSR